MENSEKVAFVIACVDCRHHVSEAELIKQLQEVLGCEHVYPCTTAGPDGKMLQKGVSYHAAIEDACTIRDAKGATVFAVLGHYGCAGHNVPDAQHDADTDVAAQMLADAVGFEAEALIFAPNDTEAGPTWGIKKRGTKKPLQRSEVA